MIARITRYSRLRDKHGIAEELPWSELFRSWENPGPFLGDEEHPGWSPARLEPCRRLDENVLGLSALVLDYEAPDLDAVDEEVRKRAMKRRALGKPHTVGEALSTWAGCIGCLHTTRSHRPGHDARGDTTERFRFVLPFSRDVLPAEYRMIWTWAHGFAAGALDPAPKDVSRFWYDPGTVEGVEYLCRTIDGTPLGVDSILAQMARVSVAVPETIAPKAPAPSPGSAGGGGSTTPHEPSPLPREPGGASRYGATSLARACENVRLAPRGTRNTTMAKEAFAMGGLVANGELSAEDVEQALWNASIAGGWDESAAMRTHTTLTAQLAAGMSRPRTEATRAAFRGDMSIGPEPARPQNGHAAVNLGAGGDVGGPSSLGLFANGEGGPGLADLSGGRGSSGFIPGVPRGVVVQEIELVGESGAELNEVPPPIPWVCRSLHLAPGRPTLLIAFGGSGKTFLAIDIALAVATGGTAWGSFGCKPGRVGHLNFEMPRFELRRRYQRMALGRSLPPPGDLPISILSRHHMPGWFLYPVPEVRNSLIKFTRGMSLCIVDSLRAACPSLNEDKSEARLPLDMLMEVSDETGVAFLVLHHSPKPQGNAQREERAAIYQSRGSSAIIDACDTSWVVTPASDVSQATGTLRLEMGKVSLDERQAAHHVRLIDVGEKDPETRKTPGLRLEWMPEEQIEAEADREDTRAIARCMTAIMEFIAKQGPCTTNEIIKGRAVKGRKSAKGAALDRLISTGQLSVKGGQNRSRILSIPAPTQEPVDPTPATSSPFDDPI
jgi:hypothetical protein